MIKVQGTIPRRIVFACSGGVDSMAALDFLKRSHNVVVLYYNHGTENGDVAEQHVAAYCNKHKINYLTGKLDQECPPGRSKEDWWRENRYSFLEQKSELFSRNIVTCHHLDDCVETWIWSSMHGTGKIIPYQRNKVIRPFLLTRKRDFELWANLNNVPYVQDPSNADTKFVRNYIRNEMMSHVLKVNPGIYKTVQKKVVEQFSKENIDLLAS